MHYFHFIKNENNVTVSLCVCVCVCVCMCVCASLFYSLDQTAGSSLYLQGPMAVWGAKCWTTQVYLAVKVRLRLRLRFGFRLRSGLGLGIHL